jgi:hypothetical protein
MLERGFTWFEFCSVLTIGYWRVMQSNNAKQQWTCSCKAVNVIDRHCDVVICYKCGRSQLAYLVAFTPLLPTAVSPKAA